MNVYVVTIDEFYDDPDNSYCPKVVGVFSTRDKAELYIFEHYYPFADDGLAHLGPAADDDYSRFITTSGDEIEVQRFELDRDYLAD